MGDEKHKGRQAWRMYRSALRRGISHEALKASLKIRYGVDSSRDLSDDQLLEMRAIIKAIHFPGRPKKRKKKKYLIKNRRAIV